jgi:hypothetical protein
MPVQINYVDTFQTRYFQSFENLTKKNSTKYPAVTTTQIQGTNTDGLTTYNVYDQWAIRMVPISGI